MLLPKSSMQSLGRIFMAMALWSGTMSSVASSAAPEDPVPLNDLGVLGFLAGSWQSEFTDANGVSHSIESHYTTIRGGLMLGSSRFLDGDQISFFEFESFAVKNGVVELSPSPFGTPGVSFALTEASQRFVHFENPNHAFPRVIEYRLNDDGTLYCKAAGTNAAGEPEIIEYTLVPVIH